MKRLARYTPFILALIAVFWGIRSITRSAPTPMSLKDWKVVDLTQPLTTSIPLWPGDPQFEVEAWASYAADGYFINRFSIGEHSGTHWGTPRANA